MLSKKCLLRLILVVSMVVCMGLSSPKLADACSGTPPAVPCALQLSCGFASAEIYPLPKVALISPNNAGVKLNALVHISSFNPDCQNCPELDKLVFEFHVDCSGLVEVQGAGVNDVFDKTYEVNNPKLGINEVAVGFNVKLFEPSEFSPNKPPKFKSGVCDVTADATLHLVNGATLKSTCKDGQVCFVPTITTKGNVTKPVVELVALKADEDTAGTNNSIGYPGDGQKLRYRLTNNATTPFQGALEVKSDNVNVKAVASNLPMGADPETYTFGLSEGDGDDFVVGQSISNTGDDACLPLPEQPGQSISPSTAVAIPTVMPGESVIFEVYSTTWGNCGDGSCSQAGLSIGGTVDGKPIKLCLSGNFMTSATTDASGTACTGQPTSPVGSLACTTVGQQDEAGDCEQDPNCDPDGPMSALWVPAQNAAVKGQLKRVTAPIDAIPIKEGFPGASFRLSGDMHRLYVIKAVGTETSETATSTVKDQRVDHNLTRVSETLKFSSSLSKDQKVTIKVPWALVQSIEGKASVPMMTVGSKTTPGSNATHTFVGLSDVHIDSKPGLRAELMTQVSAWLYDAQNDKLVPASLTPTNFATNSTGMELEFEMIAPTAGDELRLAYDFRSYSRQDEEQECDDGKDNDDDGKTDCEDPDCSGHPSCGDSSSSAGGGGAVGGAGGATAGAGGSGVQQPGEPAADEGCSCALVGADNDSSDAGWLGLLLASAWLVRRRQRRFDAA